MHRLYPSIKMYKLHNKNENMYIQIPVRRRKGGKEKERTKTEKILNYE